MMSGGPIELAGDGTVYLGLPPPGENPLSSAPNRVAFSPKGDPKRVRANRVSGDAPERWRFAPGTDHMLVLKATSVYLLDGDGKVLSTSARRANRQWLCGIVDASISPDGSFVVLSTSQMRGTARADEYFTLFDKAGKPLRDVPSSLRMSGSGSLWFDGVRALTLGTGQITIIEMTTGKASSIQLPGNHQILLESSVALSPDGREAWLADPDALRVTRFALP
jgi:sugar lactone lactonase YvrE